MAKEFLEWTGYAYHVRRRLTAAEQHLTGPAIDLRGTAEAKERFARLKAHLPAVALRMGVDEINEAACPR